MAQQTAVDWLDEQLQSAMQIEYTRKGIRVILIPIEWYMQCKQQAKEMEKEQIIEARADVLTGVMDYEAAKIDAEDYYNETYNK